MIFWSQMAFLVNKITLKKKVCFHIFWFLTFVIYKLFCQYNVMEQYRIFWQIGDHISKTFFPKLELLFSIKSSKMYRHMSKLCVKLRNANIYPLQVHISCTCDPIFQMIFSSLILSFQKHKPPIRLLKHILG